MGKRRSISSTPASGRVFWGVWTRCFTTLVLCVGLPRTPAFFLEAHSRRVISLCLQDFSRLSNAQLDAVFCHVSALVNQYYTCMWMVYLLNEPLADVVRKDLQVLHVPDAEATLRVFCSPLKPNDAVRERLGLLAVSLEKNKSKRNKRLVAHARAFSHLPVFDFNHEPFALSHFQREVAWVRHPQRELSKTRQSFSKRKKEFKTRLAALELATRGLTHARIALLSDAAFLRDYRDMLRQKMNVALRRLYGEMAGRMGLAVSDASLLSSTEVSGFLQGKIPRKTVQGLARQRRNGFLLLHPPKRSVVWPGPAAHREFQKRVPVSNASLLEGVTGAPGHAIGSCRVVLTNQDLGRVKKGDVLVSPMTRQNFVPYLRRCRAVVCDEGGVTCHAAIICRELKIPCIVGIVR